MQRQDEKCGPSELVWGQKAVETMYFRSEQQGMAKDKGKSIDLGKAITGLKLAPQQTPSTGLSLWGEKRAEKYGVTGGPAKKREKSGKNQGPNGGPFNGGK